MTRSEEIKKQAKAIMDDFAGSLEKVDQASIPLGIRRGEGTRMGVPQQPDPAFAEAMFKNAPRKRDGYIIAERK